MKTQNPRNRRLVPALAIAGVIVLGSAISPHLAAAEQPAITPLFQYQGVLTDPRSNGKPIEGEVEILFRIVDHDGEKEVERPLWEETQTIKANNGLISTVLGTVEPIPADIFDGSPLWLSIVMDRDQELTPFQPLLPTAYAMRAETAGDADTLGGLEPGDFVPRQGPVTVSAFSTSPTLSLVQSNPFSLALSTTGEVEVGDLTAGDIEAGNLDVGAIQSSGDIEADDFSYNSFQSRVKRISAYDFRPDDSETQFRIPITTRGFEITGPSGQDSYSARASVQLPTGAVVRTIRARLRHPFNDELAVRFQSISSTGGLTTYATITTPSNVSGIEVFTADNINHVVSDNFYYLITVTGENWATYGVNQMDIRYVIIEYDVRRPM